MAFRNIPPNGFPALPDVEDLESVEKDVTTLKSSVLGLTQDVTDLTSQKANQITIAPFFNSETAYDIGDLVYYNGLTYRCTNAHEGEWDADDFTGTTIANELDSLKSGLTNLSTITVVSNLFEMDDTKVADFNAARCGNMLSLYGRVHGLATNSKIGSFPSGLRASIKSICIITDYNTGSPVSGNIFITPGSADIKYYGTTFTDDAEFSATIMVEGS